VLDHRTGKYRWSTEPPTAAVPATASRIDLTRTSPDAVMRNAHTAAEFTASVVAFVIPLPRKHEYFECGASRLDKIVHVSCF